jgi:hypothetical protein
MTIAFHLKYKFCPAERDRIAVLQRLAIGSNTIDQNWIPSQILNHTPVILGPNFCLKARNMRIPDSDLTILRSAQREGILPYLENDLRIAFKNEFVSSCHGLASDRLKSSYRSPIFSIEANGFNHFSGWLFI